VPSEFDPCRSKTILPVASDGTFSASVTAGAALYGSNGLVDCTATPGACEVIVQDAIHPSVAAEVPVTVRPSTAPATVRIDLRSPLAYGMQVRVVGSNWPPLHNLSIVGCQDANCYEVGGALTDSAGSFRTFVSAAGPDRTICEPTPGACSLAVTDGIDPGNITPVRIPLNFATGDRFGVASSYEPKWAPLFAQGLSASGLSAAELQRMGVAVSAYLMIRAGRTGTHLPIDGGTAYTTSYSAEDYVYWTNIAAQYAYTLEELQKVGALFWSWILAGYPPLPE
jgi:hypothetical protein